MSSKKLRIGINGFGRIGRTLAKVNYKYDLFDLVLVNDLNPQVENLAYLLKYDSTYGKFIGTVECKSGKIVIDGKAFGCTSVRDIRDVPWKDYGVDIVIEATGVEENVINAKDVTTRGSASKVIVAKSTTNSDIEIIMGINDDDLLPEHKVISNSICDANAVAHLLKWIDDEYGVVNGSLTTLHPWLSYQNLVDGPSISQSNPGIVWNDYALGRASTDSLIPKNTTAMKAIEYVLPQLKGKILSFSYRVPTDVVASADMTLNLSRVVDRSVIEDFLMQKASASKYIRVNRESLVSLDYEMEEASAVIDMQWFNVSQGLIKIILWYDNEWGYSSRMLNLASKLSLFE